MRTRAAVVGVALLATACGGAPPPALPPAASTPRPAPTREDDGLVVEGILGSLSAMEVERSLSPRMPRFERCFADVAARSDEGDLVGGRIEFAFRVARDGRVAWAFPRRSTLGHFETERCLLEVARSTTFPRPHGGEAEFSWGFELTPSEDVRPATTWEPSHVASTVARRAAEAAARCGIQGGPIALTVYVQPGGAPLAIGASTEARESYDHVECVVAAVREWRFPDPGSYPAKVTFEVGHAL